MLLPVASFYAYFEIVSNTLETEGMDGRSANAVKHAYAAATLYGFCTSLLDDLPCERAVLKFGILNEQVERITKFGKPDSYAEILKDLHNNMAGVSVTRWRHRHGCPVKTFDLILTAKQKGALVTDRKNNPLFDGRIPDRNFIRSGNEWLIRHRATIRTALEAALDHRTSCRANNATDTV